MRAEDARAAHPFIEMTLRRVDTAITALGAMADLVAQEDLWPTPVSRHRRDAMLHTLVGGLFAAMQEVHQTVDQLLKPHKGGAGHGRLTG